MMDVTTSSGFSSQPKPGDAIRMLDIPDVAEQYRGAELVVTKIGDNGRVFVRVDDDPHYIEKYVLEGWYEIVKTKKTKTEDIDVDEFLKRQRDDNLRRAFGW